MKNKIAIIKILFVFILSNISFISRGQDFIVVKWITQEGDTIPGLIKNRIIEDQYLVAKNDSNISETFRLPAEKVKTILYGGSVIYQTTTIFYMGNKAGIFLELILKGEVNLYSGSYKEMGQLYFIEKDQAIYMIPKGNINGFLKNLLGECYDNTLMKKNIYTGTSLKKVILSYNQCVHPGSLSDVNPMKRYVRSFYLGGKINYNYGKFNFSKIAYYKTGDYSNISSFGAGLVGGINLSKRLFIQTELSYLRKTSESGYVNTYPLDSAVSSQVKLDFTYLDWPLYFGYFFSQGKIRPYLAAGFNMGFLLSGGIEDRPYKITPGDFGPPFVEFDTFEFGLLGMAGVMINLNNNSAIQVNIKYSSTDTDYLVSLNSRSLGGYGAGSSNLNTQRLEISLGYIYSFIK